MIKERLAYLFSRRVQRRKWLYLVATLPPLLYALWGWEYGAFFPYLTLAVLYVLHFFYPTMFGWLILLLPYLCGTLAYGYKFISDLSGLIGGSKSAVSMFLSVEDSLVFTAIVAFLVLTTVGFFRIKPGEHAT
jgi:hypothetical protein